MPGSDGKLHWIGGAVLTFAGLALAASPSASNVMSDIRANARQVRSAAVGIELLAKEPNAQWKQFDKQWNEIKPAEDRLNINISRLEKMQATLAPAQQKTLDQTKKLVEEIASRTHALHSMLNQPNMLNTAILDNQAPEFRAESRKLATEARDLVKETGTGAKGS